jgi:hypothetical protein
MLIPERAELAVDAEVIGGAHCEAEVAELRGAVVADEDVRGLHVLFAIRPSSAPQQRTGPACTGRAYGMWGLHRTRLWDVGPAQDAPMGCGACTGRAYGMWCRSMMDALRDSADATTKDAMRHPMQAPLGAAHLL